MRLILLISLLAATPIFAQTATAAGSAATPPAAATSTAAAKPICKSIPVIGSNVARDRICLTEDQWQHRRELARATTERMSSEKSGVLSPN